MRVLCLVLLAVVSQKVFASKALPSTGPNIKSPIKCVGIFAPAQYQLKFNTENSDVEYYRGSFKFASGFKFSSDGRQVLVSHTLTTEKEKTTVLSVENLEVLGGHQYHSTHHGISDIRSASVDKTSTNLVSLSTVNKKDTVVRWDLENNKQKDVFEIPEIKDRDFVKYKFSKNDMGANFTTNISAEHPYFLRYYSEVRNQTPSNSVQWQQRDALQIVNINTQQVLNLKGLHSSVNHFNMEPFNARFQFLAQLKKDQKTLVVKSFERIEEMFNQQNWLDNAQFTPIVEVVSPIKTTREKLKAFFLFKKQSRMTPDQIQFAPKQMMNRFKLTPNMAFIHSEQVLKYTVIPWSPLVVTQTANTLNVWNVKTGELKSIQAEVTDYKVFNDSSILAYTTKDHQLHLFSVLRGIEVAVVPQFTKLELNSLIMNWSKDQLLIVNQAGHVFNLVERSDAQGTNNRYYFGPANIKLPKRLNRPLVSMILTDKEAYILQTYIGTGNSAPDSKLLVDVYKTDHNTPIKSFRFDIHDFMPQFQISPNGEKLFFTRTDKDATVIDFPQLLKAHNL